MLESLIGIDQNLYILVNSHLSNGLFDLILVPLRHKLFWIPFYLFLLSFIILNYKKQSWIVLLGIIISITLSDTISSKIIKKTVKRTRPCHVDELQPVQRVHCSHGYSFTSSHATNHFALGTYFFLLFAFYKRRWLFFIWAGLISFAQIYVGVHYPLDILAGSLIGILIGLISYKLTMLLSEFIFSKQTNLSV